MKKSFILVSIGLWTVVIIAVIILADSISKGRVSNMIISGSTTLLKSEEVTLGNAKNITIDTTRQSIQILKTTGDKIRIMQYGNPDTVQDEVFQVSSSGDKIHIYINRNFSIQVFNFVGEEKLLVEIPESFRGDLEATASSGSIKVEDDFNLENANLYTSSGSAQVNDSLTADKLGIITTSGSVKLNGYINAKNISAGTTSGSIQSSMDLKAEEEIELSTSSGSIHLDRDVTARSIRANTNSGGIHMENVYVEAYDLQCTSGSIKISGISGGGNVRTSSGSITLTLIDPKGDVYLNTTSGSIKAGLEPSLQFTLTVQTTSGGIKTNFPADKNERGNYATASIGDNPTVNIIAKASSGGIRIEN